jgi:hypothetical protein
MPYRKARPEVLTADVALVAMCLWMRELQADLSRAVADLHADAERAQADTVAINGQVYMRYMGLASLPTLRRLTLDNARDERAAEGRKVYDAIERGDWFEIDGNEHAGVLLNSEELEASHA